MHACVEEDLGPIMTQVSVLQKKFNNNITIILTSKRALKLLRYSNALYMKLAQNLKLKYLQYD